MIGTRTIRNGEADPMKIIVMGAGALGSISAALLHAAGHDVALVARGARAEHLRANGIRVEGLAEVTAACPIVTDPATLTEADLLIMTVKTFDTAAALQQLAHVRPASCLSLQNGVQKDDQLAATFGREAVLGAIANFSGAVRDDGVALFTVNASITVGEPAGGVSPRAQAVVDALNGAGINAHGSADIVSTTWSKLIIWSGMAIVSTLTREPSVHVFSDPDTACTIARIHREVQAIAEAEGAVPEPVPPYSSPESLAATDEAEMLRLALETGAFFQANAPLHKHSMLQDLERGKRLEVDETLGDLVARGRRLGVPVPTVEAGYRMIAGMDRIRRAAG
ncbi:MAG: ketopantoate reductase family protein [Alphaproteobacteria bacterium]|nr:ketopantoate reductase family protein [Alphaproteobacteria bacterium]MCB9931641.1 ketopantoate reductase family protein [Alphaproteobacteria bacterium]